MAILWILTALSPVGAHAQTAVTSQSGRITAMDCAGEYLPIQTNLVIPLKGWNTQRSLSNVQRPRPVREGGKTTWSGSIPMASGKAYRFEQTLHDAGDTVTLELNVSAEADIETEGVYFWLDVPIRLFAGGDCSLSGGETPRNAVFPQELPAVEPRRGILELDLAPQSLLTLTTMQ